MSSRLDNLTSNVPFCCDDANGSTTDPPKVYKLMPWYAPYVCGKPVDYKVVYPTPHFAYGYYTRNAAPREPQAYESLVIGGHTAVAPFNKRTDPTLNYHQHIFQCQGKM